jgi:DNA-binding beta-propeller fold protein YncE
MVFKAVSAGKFPKVFAITWAIIAVVLLAASGADAADIVGKVQGANSPIAGSTVTLFAAGTGAPVQLAQGKTDEKGSFKLSVSKMSDDSVLYVVARGGASTVAPAQAANGAIALLAVLGTARPKVVTVNEFTTVASVWTSAQFLEGDVISGHQLGLHIAAGNVPNFVDLETGGYGPTIQDPLNSTQTPTMANFATLSTLLAGCVTQVRSDSCSLLFAATTPPNGKVPSDTLMAMQSVARDPGYQAKRLFALLDAFYPVPNGKTLRPTPFMPYLSSAPSAWVLPLKFAGGGLSAPGKIMFDSEGNAWTGDNFIVGSQAGDVLWDGNLTKIAPNGRPLSPITTGYNGGGLEGPGFGTAVAADGKVWVDSTAGKTISLFDNNGQPLSPPEGYNFNGQLGLMQGIIVAPNGDVWALDFGKDQVVHFPNGDPSKGRVLCQAPEGKPNKDGPCKLSGPFHLAIDQQDRIWITNAIGDTVTRFSASDPSKVEVFSTGGHSGKGMAIDSKGNAWITNTLGDGLSLSTKLKLLWLKLDEKMKEANPVVLADLLGNPGKGSVSMLRPDGSPAPGSPFKADGSLWGAWGAAMDGNDQVWISNFVGGDLVHLCGVRTETCRPGMKTGDRISPPGGYAGGGMQMLTDVAIDPAGNVWVANNWQNMESCYGRTPEPLSTRCGGQGVTVFYGMAKPVRAPQIGPARPY